MEPQQNGTVETAALVALTALPSALPPHSNCCLRGYTTRRSPT
jgi:hypothetical protein